MNIFYTHNVVLRNLSIFMIVVFLSDCFVKAEQSEIDKLKNSAQSKLDGNDYQGAIKDFSKAIELSPKDAEAYVSRALAKAFSNDNKGASKDASLAIEYNPKLWHAYYVRGTAKRRLKDYKGAIIDFSKIIENPIGDYKLLITAYSGRAGAKEDVGDDQGAISDYTEVLKIDSKRAITYFLRGAIKLRQGDKQGSLSDMSKAGELGHTDAYDVIQQINKKE